MQTTLDTYIQNIYRVSTSYKVGEGELEPIFEKDALFFEDTQKLHKIMNKALRSQGLLFRVVACDQGQCNNQQYFIVRVLAYCTRSWRIGHVEEP